MTKTSIGSQVHQPLYIHRYPGAEFAFHRVFTIDELADAVNLGFREIIGTGIRADIKSTQDSIGCGPTDAMDICQPNLNALATRQIYACNSCQGLPPLSLPLLMAFILADDSDHPFSAHNLALDAHFLN